MSLRIDKLWGNIFPINPRKKDLETSIERAGDQSQNQNSTQQDTHQEPKENPKKEPDRKIVEQAIYDLQLMDQFIQTGMKVEMVDSKDGLQVRLLQTNGATVKTMFASDFLRLREDSADNQSPRGKILDQKF